jgi:tetratricopeptide (TPR) repeat protein
MAQPSQKKTPSPEGNPGHAPDQPWWQRDQFRAALLIVALVLAYQPVWHAGIIWDDDKHMIGPALRSGHGLEQIWFQPGATQQYYPVAYTVFWLEQKLWGDAPLGYHLVNVVLHIGSALLVVKILRRLDVPGAWLGAALWALHPVQVESVAWISELKNTLSGVCYLGGALAYLRFDREGSRKFYWLALILFVTGLLAKTVIATLPAALLLIFWWKRKKLRWKEDVLPLTPFFIAGLGLGLFTAWVERTYVIGPSTTEFNLSLLDRGLIAGRVVWFYLGKLAWPHPLIFIYPRWDVSGSIWWQYLFPVAALLLAATLWRWRRRFGDAPLVALLFFVGTLFPALGFLDVYPFRYSFVADHFQYLACLGPLALAGAGITTAFRSWKKANSLLQPALMGMLLLTLGILTWSQGAMYANMETLWRTTLARNPDCWMAYNNLGHILHEKGQKSEAMALYEQAFRLNPNDAEAHNNLGNVLFQTGKLAEAIKQYEEAVRIRPGFAEALDNLGNALQQTGRMSEAIDQYQQSLRIYPDYALAHYHLGAALLQTGQMSEAVEQFQQVLRIKPDDASAHYDLGNALQQAGRLPEAIEQFELALLLNPDDAEFHTNLGSALFQAGRLPEAMDQYDQALRLKPDDADSHDNLGLALFHLGRTPEAIEQYQQALRIDPQNALAHRNLGTALLQTGHLPEALEQFEQALRLKPDDAGTRNNLGLVLWKTGRHPEAIAQFEQSEQINPLDAETHYNLGYALQQTGQVPEAIEQYEEALQLKPDFTAARNKLVKLHAIQNAPPTKQ